MPTGNENDPNADNKADGGLDELSHDTVPPYPRVFATVFAAAAIYLLVIMLLGGGAPGAGH